MSRTRLALVLVVVVVGAGIAPLVAAAAPATPTATGDGVQPGERLAGVVGVQGAELQSDMSTRTFAQRLGAANSNASKATIVATEVSALEDRLAALRERKATLDTAVDNGSISQGRYAAQMARLIAAEQALTRMLNVTADAAAGLPPGVLTEHGVNVSAIQELRRNASGLTGAAVSAIARQIAGPPRDPGNGSDRGAAGRASGAIQRAEAAIATADQQVTAAAERVGEDNDQLETARERLESAREALADARDAADNGNYATARSLADDARSLAQAARDLARSATPGGPPDDDDADSTTAQLP